MKLAMFVFVTLHFLDFIAAADYKLAYKKLYKKIKKKIDKRILIMILLKKY